MRIAFLSSEFVTDSPDSGGLANYLHRMGRLLVERGHEVEVFIPSTTQPAYLDHHGISVHRVVVPAAKTATKFWARFVRRTRSWDWFFWQAQARALAAAMEARHAENPFRLVQSADYLAVGLGVASRSGRTHVIRCSSAADLYDEADGLSGKRVRDRGELERLAMRRADAVYAPSRFIARHFGQRHGIRVQVVRPPAALEIPDIADTPEWVPPRFLLHFGQLSARKGTLWLIEALKCAFEQQPDLKLLMVGKDYTGGIGAHLAKLGARRSNVLALYGMPKEQLYAVLQAATASVVPSLVDNLPNTAIESLMLGIPVIGTRGASIDELVVEGQTGELASPGNVNELAGAILRMWRGESPVRKGFEWKGEIVDQMQSESAVDALLELATSGQH